MFVIYYKFYDARPVSGPPQAARPSCALLKRHETRPRPPRRKLTPPWFPLLQDYPATVRTGKNLYVWPDLAAGFRLGNILFNYAATFGIAWRNGRIPLWPERPLHKNYDLARLFSLRVPLDRNKTIMRVSGRNPRFHIIKLPVQSNEKPIMFSPCFKKIFFFRNRRADQVQNWRKMIFT